LPTDEPPLQGPDRARTQRGDGLDEEELLLGDELLGEDEELLLGDELLGEDEELLLGDELLGDEEELLLGDELLEERSPDDVESSGDEPLLELLLDLLRSRSVEDELDGERELLPASARRFE
jgi:hypothetical protein